MSNYWFFLSYARRDAINNTYLQKFYEELAQALAVTLGLASMVKESEIGFIDRQGIGMGDTWDATLAEALQSSKVFICLYSPAYFNSEMCGKELQVFLSRVEDYRRQHHLAAGQPELIIPILWEPLYRLPKPLPLPQSVSKLQFSHGDLPPIYEKEGLSVLMKKNKEIRDRFTRILADKIKQETSLHRLPPVQNPRALDDIQSAFLQPVAPAPAPAAAGEAQPATLSVPVTTGPDVAWFVYAAGRDADYSGFRKHIECYGASGGRDWRPYLPEVDKKVGLIAQGVAESKNLMIETVPISDRLIDYLRTADARNTIVVLLVDPWSTNIPAFKKPMKAYDENRLLNSGAVVIWNSDTETVAATDNLKQALRTTFPNIIVSQDIVFQDSVRSESELREKLSAVIDEIQRKISARAKLFRPVESNQNEPFPTLNVFR